MSGCAAVGRMRGSSWHAASHKSESVAGLWAEASPEREASGGRPRVLSYYDCGTCLTGCCKTCAAILRPRRRPELFHATFNPFNAFHGMQGGRMLAPQFPINRLPVQHRKCLYPFKLSPCCTANKCISDTESVTSSGPALSPVSSLVGSAASDAYECSTCQDIDINDHASVQRCLTGGYWLHTPAK